MFRLSQAGVKLGDYASLMRELLAYNDDPLAPAVYEAIDTPFEIPAAPTDIFVEIGTLLDIRLLTGMR
jgi:hypothetical protein